MKLPKVTKKKFDNWINFAEFKLIMHDIKNIQDVTL